MSRLRKLTLLLVAASWAVAAAAACASATTAGSVPGAPDAGRDAKIVTPDDGGNANDAGVPPPTPSCERYCELVEQNCKGIHRQYASVGDCRAFCAHLPEGKPGVTQEPTLACRQYYAGNPALANPSENCRAAGPFGGDNKCGSRCTAFCDVALSACTSTNAPYATQPDCEGACTGYMFLDPAVDGGGEGPSGPSSGDTLNCRLYWLRKAVVDGGACAALGEQSAPCN
jgi:hypothetical protein